MVVAHAVSLFANGGDKQVLMKQRVDEILPTAIRRQPRRIKDLGTKFSVKFVHEGGSQQEITQQRRLLVQNLVGQVAVEIDPGATDQAHTARHVQLRRIGR